MAALVATGEAALAGKVLIDVSNPLDFSRGMPPTLDPVNTDSLSEQIQRAFPAVRVVKALNTMNCQVMVEPGRVPTPDRTLTPGPGSAGRPPSLAPDPRGTRWTPKTCARYSSRSRMPTAATRRPP